MLDSVSGVREFTAMRKRYRLFFSLLVTALFFLSGWAYVAGQEKKPSAGNGTRWSDPATWPDRKVPAKGDAVTIGRDMNVVLDVSPPALRSLTIDGKLSFANNRDLELTNDVPGEDIMTMGDRGIMLMGGTLSLHGNRKQSWTKLAKTAAAGSTTIE